MLFATRHFREEPVGHFDLAIQTGTGLHPYGEPADFISDYTALLRYRPGPDVEMFEVGKLHAYRIHADLVFDHGKSLLDVYDAYPQQLHNVYAAVYDPTRDAFTEAVVEQFRPLDCDCLVIDYVAIDPRWRGLKLGLLAVRKFVDLVGGGCGVTVGKIWPLASPAVTSDAIPPSWLPAHQSREAVKRAVHKLRRYFKQMGFERIGRSPYYGLAMDRQTPTVADLLRPSTKAGE
jgi:hypothetical protein